MFRMAYNGIYDIQQAFQVMAANANLHATVNSSGEIGSVEVISGGKYSMLPEITAIGGGGTGVTFRAVLGPTGAITSVTIVTPGSGFTSPPYLKVTGGQA